MSGTDCEQALVGPMGLCVSLEDFLFFLSPVIIIVTIAISIIIIFIIMTIILILNVRDRL